MRITPVVLLLTVCLSLAGVVWAKGPVTGEIQAFIVTQTDDGAEKVVKAREAAPGQVMEFQIVFTNNGDESVTGVQVVDPIPENTRFIPESHSSDVKATFDVSIDNGESFEPEPVKRIETQADGSQHEVIVPPSEYTHVRWLAEESLSSGGGQHRFAYRVTVN